MKTCSKCKIEKSFDNFTKNKIRKDGFELNCRECRKEIYNKNRIDILQKKKEYHIKNQESILQKKKEYCKNNRDKINAYYRIHSKKRKEKDSLYKLTCNIRTLIGMSIKGKGYTKRSKTSEYLGCTFEVFKEYIENQFKEGMSWENRSDWHLDHIHPISLAETEEEIIRLNHYTNFQPLWAEDNIRKGNRLNY